MPEITAQTVKALRDRTGLPMMECKQALIEAQGDADAAVDILRKKGGHIMAGRAERETTEGRIACHTTDHAGAMIELLCESAPVAKSDPFVKLAAALARQLAEGPGAADVEALLEQAAPGGRRLADEFADAGNVLREKMQLRRILRYDGVVAAYQHHNGMVGVLLQAEGSQPNRDLLRDICMHIAAMRPLALSSDDFAPAVVAKEREIYREQARATGKPPGVIEKIVQGKLASFFKESALLEQEFVKDETGTKPTVRQVVKAAGLKLLRFDRWELGAIDHAERAG